MLQQRNISFKSAWIKENPLNALNGKQSVECKTEKEELEEASKKLKLHGLSVSERCTLSELQKQYEEYMKDPRWKPVDIAVPNREFKSPPASNSIRRTEKYNFV